eukprot:jgi/Tetstr1/433845/TSEL_023029.t1
MIHTVDMLDMECERQVVAPPDVIVVEEEEAADFDEDENDAAAEGMIELADLDVDDADHGPVCKEAWIFIHKVSFLRLWKIAQSRLPTDCTDWPTKLMSLPIEFFPLTTKSACFMVGNLAQTVRHFGFSETAANKIASALDMVPAKVFSHTAPSRVRKLRVRALPDPVNEHAYADRMRALQDSNGSQGAWPEASWQYAVESVLFVERQSKTVCVWDPCSGFAGTAHALFGRARRVLLSDVNPSRVSHFVADALSPEMYDKTAAMCKEPFVVVTSP